jgi:hypothetical protein
MPLDVTVKSFIFWDITPCSPVKVNRRFGRAPAYISRVEDEVKQEISMKQAANRGSMFLRFVV